MAWILCWYIFLYSRREIMSSCDRAGCIWWKEKHWGIFLEKTKDILWELQNNSLRIPSCYSTKYKTQYTWKINILVPLCIICFLIIYCSGAHLSILCLLDWIINIHHTLIRFPFQMWNNLFVQRPHKLFYFKTHV